MQKTARREASESIHFDNAWGLRLWQDRWNILTTITRSPELISDEAISDSRRGGGGSTYTMLHVKRKTHVCRKKTNNLKKKRIYAKYPIFCFLPSLTGFKKH